MTTHYRLKGRGLSAKLLGLTLAFIMLAEVLVLLPSIGRALQVYGQQTIIELERGVIAFEVLDPHAGAAQLIDSDLTMQQVQALQMQLLDDTGWQAFAVRFPGNRSILAGSPVPARQVDLGRANPIPYIGAGFALILDFGPAKTLRFTGQTRDKAAQVDIWLSDVGVRTDLRAYAGRILLLSLGISIFSAALVYLSLRWLIVRPIERLRAALMQFARTPQNLRALIQPSSRRDEIGFIELETRAMQETIVETLQQKERLAILGSAVAQINHDLRGMLSTALLLSDSLETSKDPNVAKSAPILAHSIERAVALCANTLRFAKGMDTAVSLETLNVSQCLAPLIADWQARWPLISISVQGAEDTHAQIDTIALHRILDNLARNAVEAGSKTLSLNWIHTTDGDIELSVGDTGPGLPDRAQVNMFMPFKGSTKREGTGLGISSAAELAAAMGGALELEKTDAQGTIFRLRLVAACP